MWHTSMKSATLTPQKHHLPGHLKVTQTQAETGLVCILYMKRRRQSSIPINAQSKPQTKGWKTCLHCKLSPAQHLGLIYTLALSEYKRQWHIHTPCKMRSNGIHATPHAHHTHAISIARLSARLLQCIHGTVYYTHAVTIIVTAAPWAAKMLHS